MSEIKVNNLFTFDFYGHTKEDKQLVQSVFKDLLSIFDRNDSTQWFKVAHSKISNSTIVETTYYKNGEQIKEEFPYNWSIENLLKTYAILSDLPSINYEYLDRDDRYALSVHGSEEYFEFTVFDRDFMNADKMMAAGFVSESVLNYLKEAVSEKKNIAILGNMFSGKSTLLEIISNLMEDKLIVSFERSNEIKNEKNTIVRINYKDLSEENLDNHVERISAIDPDYVLYDEPTYQMFGHAITPFIITYLNIEGKSYNSLPPEFRFHTDIVIVTGEDDSKILIEEIIELNEQGEFVPVLESEVKVMA